MITFSKSSIDKLGKTLRATNPNNTDYQEIITNLNAWRKAHGPIMDYYFTKCCDIANNFPDSNILVSERLKRLNTILDKIINREPKNEPL